MIALGLEDRARTDLLEAMRLAESLGEEYRIQLVGLELDRLNQDREAAEGRAIWFEESGLGSGADLVRRYFPPASSIQPRVQSPQVQLQVLGPARISLSEKVISSRGTKRLELLVCLLEARITGRSEVTHLELFDALYPNVSEDQAAQSLKKIVQLVRDQLGRGAIQTTANGYAIAEVRSDAEEFLETLDTRLWHGMYLESVRLEQRNETVRDVLHHALHSRIETVIEVDPKEAARASRILLEAEPYDTGVLELTMRSLRASDNHKGLNRTYQEARTRWLEVGETLPERWQDFLEMHTLKPA
jgi:hypothetical protein